MGKCGRLACFLEKIDINLQYMKMTQTQKFEEKICSFIQEHQMLLPGERVVAGISGGADSVCLLFMLLEWRKRYGLELAVVHINHMIRGEAGEDARFVEDLCKRYEIPFYLREVDIPRLAEEQKRSEEEMGRICRYHAFGEVAELFHGDKIAVAHNRNDCCETMLFHLFRGSGVKGLAGIPPMRDKIIRPLLCVERREIEEYLAAVGQVFCRDVTNDADDYTRNRIRHSILSCAEEEIAPGCVQRMGQTAQLLAETEDYLQQQTRAAIEQCVTAESLADEKYILDCETFLTFHPAIQKRILYEMAKELSPGARDITRSHVEDLHSLFIKEGNRKICLPFGIRGRREYGKVILETLREGDDAGTDLLWLPSKQFDGEMTFSPLSPGYLMDMKVISREDLSQNKEKTLIFPQNQYTKWFDYDKMKKSPVIRTREKGDYLMIRDAGGELHHKKLKDYMVTEKIPMRLREKIPVLAEDSHVLWLMGYRISEYYKISENTKRILQVQLITDCESSHTEEKRGRTY